MFLHWDIHVDECLYQQIGIARGCINLTQTVHDITNPIASFLKYDSKARHFKIHFCVLWKQFDREKLLYRFTVPLMGNFKEG